MFEGSTTTLALVLGPFDFARPIWLLVIPILGGLSVWIARQSLSGLGTTSRRLALVARIVVITLLAASLARPNWRNEADTVSVIAVIDASASMTTGARGQSGVLDGERFIEEAARIGKGRTDKLGRVTAAAKAYFQSLPSIMDDPSSRYVGSIDGTNLGEAIELTIAGFPGDTANRIVLISDGNQTAGDVISAARSAKALGVPIDVYPQRYDVTEEVIVERVVAPATARMNETISVQVLVRSQSPASGRLTVLLNDDPIDLDPASEGVSRAVDLATGLNTFAIPVAVPIAGAVSLSAEFVPDPGSADVIVENNVAETITFMSSEGRVLILANDEIEVRELTRALAEARIASEVRPPTEAPESLVSMSPYDAIVMVNTPVDHFSLQQQRDLYSYVHDQGGGLVMIGGDEAFGAGGWIGSPLADALPVKLDPPQRENMPRGALALIMHSCEMPKGNFWGKQVAKAATDRLSRLDLVGMLEYDYQRGYVWTLPLQTVGDRAAVNRAINGLAMGDAQTFQQMMTMALNGLQNANAGQKHVIIISDGDPTPPPLSLLDQYAASNITVSTVLVFPHSFNNAGTEVRTMRGIANRTGGNFYGPIGEADAQNLPSIFIKEAVKVTRPLIWEGEPFNPAITDSAVESMRGIRAIPQITGYVVTAERDGPVRIVMRGMEEDPILAQWQFGLGRSLCFMSDASTRWAQQWTGWGQYRAFWEQQIRWAMRPSGSADMRVVTEDLGDRTKIVIEALDPGSGERLNFLRLAGRVTGPDGSAQDLAPIQVGPGRYEAIFDSASRGSYVMNFRYRSPTQGEDAGPMEGTVQAAFTRPFADEYRALTDNAALLQEVARITGGNVLDGDPRNANLWRRDGLDMPVALTPIWLPLTIIGVGLFLTDVAVRRVRIDLLAILGAFKLGEARKKAGESMASLREARERARESMTGDGAQQGAQPNAEQKQAAPKTAQKTSKVKFEATPQELARQRGKPAPLVDLTQDAPKPADSKSKPGPDAGADGEGGMSRLLKAKKRAQDEMQDED